jgi:hypothetical protein
MDAEFLDAWKPSGTSVPAKECVKEYHTWCVARGLPKPKVMLADLFASLEARGFHVDPVTKQISPNSR